MESLGKVTAATTTRPLWVCLVTALVSLLVLVSGIFNPYLLLVSVVIVVLGISVGWGQLLQAPDPIVNNIVVGICGMASLAAVFFTRNLSLVLLGIVPFLMSLAFIAEILRGKNRKQVTWSITASVSGCLIAAAGAAWVLTLSYPLMSTLAWASLPAVASSSLTLFIPCRDKLLRGLICLLTGAFTAAVITFFYLYQFSDLALAVPYAVLNPRLGVWTMTITVGALAGTVVACVDILFPLPNEKTIAGKQLALTLLPTLFMAMPVYAITRLIMG